MKNNNMTNGIPETKEEYDAIINPDEHARRMAIIQQGSRSAQARAEAKKRMLSRMAWKKKKVELSDNYDC